MKKVLSLLIITALVFSLCACGKAATEPETTTKSIYEDADILEGMVKVSYDPKEYKLYGNEFHSVSGNCIYTAKVITTAQELEEAKQELESINPAERKFTYPAGRYQSNIALYFKDGTDTYSGICVVDFAGEYAAKGLYGVKFFGDSDDADVSVIERFHYVLDSLTVVDN